MVVDVTCVTQGQVSSRKPSLKNTFFRENYPERIVKLSIQFGFEDLLVSGSGDMSAYTEYVPPKVESLGGALIVPSSCGRGRPTSAVE